jgi:exodeoxyribonuclease X
MKYLPVSIDFETTDKDPAKAHPIECALYTGHGHYDCFLIKSPILIPPETSAVHHIIDTDLEKAITWEEGQEQINRFLAIQLTNSGCDRVLLIAHNAKYEQTIMAKTVIEVPHSWVCTYKCAMETYATAPSFSNEALRYWIPLDNLGRMYSQSTHSALHDAKVTMGLFMNFQTRLSDEEMIKISSEPARFPKIPFGKWRGYEWGKIPADYLTWMLRQGDMEADIKECAKRELARRRT